MRTLSRPILILFTAAALTSGAAAHADPTVTTPTSANAMSWSAECAAGLLAGLVAALTTGSSAAVGCPT
ncbi:hypothetical protein IU501_29020 [Nocardia otitidiscaviarum]|uniref:hypothetical protein n=1 Tax=Nocardia otitidiscaviarum TaxID=1823 RepID=UPI0004A6C389|nr:hypothetical protein [Nocardia otitidiscaviarum]MBF6137027.1 hypothetical protein [Nocardia otitidiscaviarum]MBF6179968.1 hypothetical protein [Nocardia otitidiscaviarum]MBF6485227.1 hypothetical protein [Nocardia otitidiscaviarum]